MLKNREITIKKMAGVGCREPVRICEESEDRSNRRLAAT